MAAGAGSLAIGAPTLLEYYMVAAGRLGQDGRNRAERLIVGLDLRVVDWTQTHAKIAADAFVRFGKGRHLAALNFGDCMAYATAKSLDAPLLFKGEDFARTDIRSALA